MAERVLIAQSERKSVYREGDRSVKIFAEGFSKAEVLNEALNTARVEETGLPVSGILEVSLINGKWALTKEYIEGKTLYQMMQEDPFHADRYIDIMVDLQMEIHKQSCPLLNRLKEKLVRQIQSLTELDSGIKYDMLTRLDGMPRHLKLCHGDFEPRNLIVKRDVLYVIDWAHAAQGNAGADVARSYLLLALEDAKQAELYLDTYCEKSGTKKSYVQNWMPIVAAARLSKNRPEEKELLLKWVNVFECL